MIKAARAAYAPDLEVPEALVLRARDMVVVQAALGEPEAPTPSASAASFLLGSGTVLVAAAGTGSLGGGSVLPIVLTTALGGVAAVYFERRQPRGAPA